MTIKSIMPVNQRIEVVVEVKDWKTVRRPVIGFALVHDEDREEYDQDQLLPVVFDPEEGCTTAIPEAYENGAVVRYEVR